MGAYSAVQIVGHSAAAVSPVTIAMTANHKMHRFSTFHTVLLLVVVTATSQLLL
jgi:hypothetical protein